MYTPDHFDISDTEILVNFIRDHSFGLLITSEGNKTETSHLPFLVEQRSKEEIVLVTHLAKSNPHSRLLETTESCLAIFQGPHAYISPRFYAGELNVPTWNYSTVHALCTPRVFCEQEDISKILDKTIGHYEAVGKTFWQVNLPAEFRSKLTAAIVGIELRVTRLEGKFKLSQNRNKEDYQSVLKEFESRTDDNSRELLKYMRLTMPAHLD